MLPGSHSAAAAYSRGGGGVLSDLPHAVGGIAPLGARTTTKAWAVQDEAGLAWWDALLVAAALMEGCKHFVSEDMRDGQLISGMKIVNFFRPDF
jgi:predicted nucleic acid-binding protein